MTEGKMKDLLFSLAWYDASAHHSRNAREILASEFPGADFAAALDEFVKCKKMSQGPGNPRDAEIERLRDAVQATIDVVHSWHGPVGWGIYLRDAPELQKARDALRIVTPND